MQSDVAFTAMQDNLIEKAIQAALEGSWQVAVDFNLNFLRDNPKDIAALNRLGRAYTELNQLEKARKTYRKVLSIDSYNPIAKKNLKRLKGKKNHSTTKASHTTSQFISSNFLEEPGKTKSTQLVRLADNEVISGLQIGQKLILASRKRAICVKTNEDTYIGSLPDDLSSRLGRLVKLGNKYEILVKSLEGHSVQIFIRETYRSKRLKNTPSFPTTQSSSYYSDIKHALLNEEPLDLRQTGEED
jgi:hypothetical protein